MKSVAIFFLILTVIPAFLTQENCGPNEVYRTCGTVPECETNCNTNPEVPIECPAVCIRGCFCRLGFVRTSSENRECIPVNQC